MHKGLVLLVDSDEDTRIILRDALEYAGYAVLSTPTGGEGLRLAATRRPDVIIGDFPMDVPGHSAFTADVRQDANLRHTRILAVTGRAMAHQLSVARAICDAVLVKPVEPQLVVEEVGRLIAAR